MRKTPFQRRQAKSTSTREAIKSLTTSVVNFFRPAQNRAGIRSLLGCLLFSAVFWFFNALNKTYQTNIRYPVSYRFDKQKFKMDPKSERHIEVMVSGYGWYLLERTFYANLRPLKLQIRSSGNGVETNSFLPALYELLPELVINGIKKDSLHYHFIELSVKNIYLRPDIKSIMLPKYARIEGPIKVEPCTITCSGPVEELALLPDTLTFSLGSVYAEKNVDESITLDYKPLPGTRITSGNKIRVRFSTVTTGK